jgi:hypothetical protein
VKWNQAIGPKDYIKLVVLLGLVLCALIITASLPSADVLPSALSLSPSSSAVASAPMTDGGTLTRADPQSPFDVALSSGRLAQFSR